MDDQMCLPSGSKSTDFTRDELIKLLVYFEGELEAKEIAIAALKAEKARNVLQHVKYSRLKIGDPVMSLSKDSNWTQNDDALSLLDKELKQYENPIIQLEKYIAITKQYQVQSRQSLKELQRQHEEILQEIEREIERSKAGASPDKDMIAILEDEKNNLQYMLDKKEETCKQLENELEKKTKTLNIEREKHKMIILYLINERKEMLLKMHEMKLKMQNSNTHFNEAPFVSELKKEIHSLREEKNRLNSTVSHLHADKTNLQKRVEELEEDLMMLRQNILFKTRQQSDGFVRQKNVGGLVVANKAAIASERNHQPMGTIKTRLPNSSSFPATVPSTSKNQQGGAIHKKFPTISGSVLPRPNIGKPPIGVKSSNLPVRPYTANSTGKQTEPEIEQLGAVIDSMVSRPKTTGSITKRSTSLPRNMSQTSSRFSEVPVNTVTTHTLNSNARESTTKIGHSLSPNKVFRLVSGSLPRPMNLPSSNENLKKPSTTHIS